MSTPSDSPSSHLPRALAFALYALLLDAAAETWWSGSPVRWWVVAAAATYAAATGLLWRRMTWQSKAAISLCVFLGVVAMTAWLPGGLSMGVRLAGRRTSTLLSLLSAAAVALSAVVVWRFRAVPRAARTGVGVLAAYGLIAFAYGVIGDVPFADLFSGDSVWQRLPALLQGAFVGGVVVVPLALLTSVVRAGIPRLREGSPRYALYQIVALSTSLAIVLAALPLNSQRRSDAGPGTTTAGFSLPAMAPIVPSPALSDALENSLRAVADGERESPRDRWDPAYVVEQVGKDPQQLVDWVASNTSWIPYRGLLRGPVGVLMDRLGNSLDRAVLLATLLKQAGHSVRLAHGELTNDQAAGLLPALIVARTDGTRRDSRSASLGAGDVKRVAAQYSLDGPAIEQSLGSSTANGDRVFSALEVRTADQTERLRAAIGRRAANGDRSTRIDSAIDLLRDHWWVQRQNGGSWIDLDLLSNETTALTTAQETVALDGIAPSQVHQVVVRVVAEQWSDGKVAERIALQHALKPAELIGKPIVLRFWPRRWPSKMNPGPDPRQYLRTTALTQHEWVATLQIGRDTAAQSSLLENGDINDHPMMNDFAKIGGSAGGAAGDAASLLGGLAPEPTQAADKKTMLTAAWLEFEIRTPGEPSRTRRHTVFDLLGPTARAARPVAQVGLDDAASLLRSLSLMMETEILPVGGRIAPEFYRHLVAESLLGNREILSTLVRGEISETATRPEDLGARLAPVPGPLYPLAMARLDRSRVSDQIYVVSPNVLTRHVFPAPAGGDRIALRDATDIVANEVGVDLRVKDAFAVRFEQGVFDTNAETLLQLGHKTAGSTANAFATNSEWVTLTSADQSQLASLRFSDDDRRRVAQDLAAGSVVVLPKAPIRMGGDEFVGWWRVDPARGDVLGVDTRGWGVASAEYMFVVSVVIGFELGWLMCELPPPSGSDGPVARAYSPGLDLLEVPLAASGGTCLVEGVEGAVMAALFGLMGGFGNGGSGSGSGKGGSGSGGGGGGGTGSGGNGGSGSGSGKGGAGSGGGGAGGGAGSGGPGGGGAAGGGGRGGTQPIAGGRGGTQPMKTEVNPNQEFESGKTGVGETGPRTRPATDAEVASAKQEFEAAQKESVDATKKFVDDRQLKPNPGRNFPGDPSRYDPVVDEANANDMIQKAGARNEALSKLQDAQQALPRPSPVGRGGGIQPARPEARPAADLFGCPPNCGNENKTGRAQNVQVPGQDKSVVGAAGVSNVLSGKQ